MLDHRPPRRIPAWAKIASVVVVVVLVAVGNMAAKKRQERAALAAADRVDVTMLTSAGEARDHEFEVTLLVLNHGSSPITVKAGRRVVPAEFDALPFEDRVIDVGTTEQLAVPFTPRCSGAAENPAQPSLSLVVPIVPGSGRVRDVSTPLETTMMWDLSRRACGYLSADEAAEPSVRDVSSTHYAVRFRMLLLNRSDRPFVLRNLTSPGLALSVLGGVPLTVAPHRNVDLAVSVALPACSRLPAPGSRGRGAMQQFGTIVLELRDESNVLQPKPYLPSADLSAALAALRARICPVSLQPPTRSHPRGFG